MKSIDNTAGEMIRNARKQAGLTQQQLSDKYGMSLRTIESWEGSVRVPPEYVLNLLLRCLAIDFPTEPVQDLSEPKAVSKPAEPTYVFTDPYGKPLSPKLTELVKIEFTADKVAEQPEHTQDFYGESIPTTSKKGKLYLCTDPKPSLDLDPENEIPMGFMFRVKEV